MGEIFAKIIDLITDENTKRIKRLFVIVLILLPVFFIVGNYFYGNIRFEQKVRILKELSSIKESEIENLQLKEYYNQLVSSLVKRDMPSIENINVSNDQKFNFSNSIVLWKFLSGSVLGILLMFISLLAKYEKAIMKVFGFILVGIITGLIAGFGLLIPTLDPPMINYIGYPVIQLILLVIGITASQKRKQK